MKVLINGYKDLFDGKGVKGVTGGPRLFTQQLVDFLRKNGHSFVGVVVSSKLEQDEIVEIERYPVEMGEWVNMTLRLNLKAILNSADTKINHLTKAPLQKLKSFMISENPDVIFLNGYSVVNWYLLHAAHQAGIPIVAYHHGLFVKEITDHTVESKESLLALAVKMERDISKLADAEIFLNNFSQDLYEKALKVSVKDRSEIIDVPYNPIFSNKKFPLPNKGKIKKIGFVGRWDPIKNPQIFYAIAKESKRQKKPWEFYAVVKIDKHPALKSLEKKFKNLIKVKPPCLPAELKQFYQQMDILILPSRFDASGAVVAEAALQNRGTLISPNVGFNEIYRKTGMEEWIDDFEDLEGVISKIEKFSRHDLPPKFVKFVKRNNDPKVAFKKYLSIIESISKKK